MERIANNVLETVGNTPLVRIRKLNTGKAEIVVKVESFNPGGSAKDRVGISMIEAAEKDGKLKPGALIIEPTSGNTGIGLALAAAIKGYHLILTMPESMSLERRRLLAAYGAELVLTPAAEGMAGSIAKAKQIQAENPGAFIPQQFENPANPAAHYKTTGPEIWRDTDGKVDVIVAGIGTGGTLTGTAAFLREKNPALKVIAVEPASSALLSGGKAGPHGLQGIGANFIPAALDRSLIDRVMPVTDADAFRVTKESARTEGLLIGISAGAALFAAMQLSQEPEYAGKRIVVILPDSGERYLSTPVFA